MIILKPNPVKKRHNYLTPDITCKRHTLFLSKRPYVMGILNRTPDSFSDGGNFMDEEKALAHVEQMVKDGADIIDVGGESTRPGSEPVGLREEIRRVVPLIEKISSNIDVPISIDTRKSAVAEAAIDAGASIVNDISALRADRRMRFVIARYSVPVVLMHMKDEPGTMQLNPRYDNLMEEIISYLKESIKIAAEAGISEGKIIIDPGIGFGKTTEHSLSIIKNLYRLRELRRPILIGTSRKSFIGSVLNKNSDERLTGTLATVAVSILNGASIVRVHDVKPAVETVRIVDSVMRSN